MRLPIRKPSAIPSTIVAVAFLAAVLVSVAAGPAAARPSGTSPIGQKQAEARKLESEIEALGRRDAMLVERFHQTELALADANRKLAGAQAQMTSLQHRFASTQGNIRRRLIDIYEGRTSASPLDLFDASNAEESALRFHYATTVAAQDRSAMDRLRQLHDDVAAIEPRLKEARDSVAVQERALAQQRREVEQTVSREKQLLSRVKGELATLIQQDEARRQAEAARQARERMAAASTRALVGPIPAASPHAQVAVSTALAQLGKPYQWGGAGPDSFDCSGLTMFAWRAAGVALPHSAAAQFSSFPQVPIGALQPGDLVFYGSPPYHNGMYIGNGQMVEAPHTGTVVRVAGIFRSDLVGASRPG